MLVYPRLPAPTADVIIEEIAPLSLDHLRQRGATRHPACIYSPTGGNRADEADVATVQATIRRIADEFGFPSDPAPAQRVAFDQAAGTALHDGMRIVPADAAEPGVWAFLTCVVLPDIAAWRFGRRTAERFRGGSRNTLRRLWWRAHVLDSPDESLTARLGEDEIVQIMERPESVLGNPRVARAVAAAHLRLCDEDGIDRRMHLLRDAAKRLLRLSAVAALDALDDSSMQRMAAGLLRESAAALGIALHERATETAPWSLAGDTGRAIASPETRAPALRDLARTSLDEPVASAVETPAFYRVFRSTARPESLEGVGLTSTPLGDLRLAIVQAAERQDFSFDHLGSAVRDQLGVEDALGPGEIRELERLAHSAATHGWIDIDDEDRTITFRALPSGNAVGEGQLMRHSLTQIAETVHSLMADVGDDRELPDHVVSSFGYASVAGRTARRIIDHVAHDLRTAGVVVR
ncbi:MAG: DUF6339 family protein [Solirubrobacteraceae bacterium]